MKLVESTRADHLGDAHASIEGCAREVDELVKVGTKVDLIAAPALLESALDLDTELARTIKEILSSWLAFFGTRCVQHSHQHSSDKVLRVDLVGPLGIIHTAGLEIEPVRTDKDLKMGHIESV